MKVLITGSSGFVGKALIPFLEQKGVQVKKLVRSRTHLQKDEIFWNPFLEEGLDRQDFEKFDAIIHLAGKGVASKRWTPKVKQEIFLSRARDTWLLTQIILRLHHPPKTVICASAIGIYGNRGDEILTEESHLGCDFLATVCKEWEKATLPLSQKGIRVVNTRFGHILGKGGGILDKILPIFKWGLGGRLGSGKQFVSWISLNDVLEVIRFALEPLELQGPINVTAPHPVTMDTFTALLAKAVHRPSLFHLPAPLLKWIFGKEMAEELFLTSVRAVPDKLLKSGYQFKCTSLEDAIQMSI